MVQSITKSVRFRITFLIWWLVWMAVQWAVIESYGFVFPISITDSILSNILLAGSCVLIINNMRFYLPQKERYWYVLIISIVLSANWLLLSKGILKFIFKHDESYLLFLDQSVYVRYILSFLMIGCMAMISLLWYTLQEQQENDQRKEEAEKMAKEAELVKLRQQLQPHFLFNSLNSISALAGSQPEKARHMIQQLSDFLRGTLKKEEHQSVTLDDELHHLQLYLDIEKVRFGHRLRTRITVNDEAGNLQIPTLLLQPVVENAIKFGLYDTIGEVMITIDAIRAQEQLVLTVTNPFDATTAINTQGTGFGLASIQRRLFLLFARNDLLRTNAQESVFTTTLIIPQHNYEGSNY
jgi:signal transduction histidine kinase